MFKFYVKQKSYFKLADLPVVFIIKKYVTISVIDSTPKGVIYVYATLCMLAKSKGCRMPH